MSWEPISEEALDSLLGSELAECSQALGSFFAMVRVDPVKWKQSPWGNDGGGFWVVAVCEDRVLWYNDIEGGFNVSCFADHGVIPDSEYWCNQDPLKRALPQLKGDRRYKLGPPKPVPTG